MELAYNVIKLNKEYNIDNFKQDIMNLKFNKLLINNKLYFIKKFNNKKYRNNINNILSNYLDVNKIDITEIILMSFYIHLYPEDIFIDDKDYYITKLKSDSNNLVQIIIDMTTIDNLITKNLEEFINILDTFYSTYRIWDSKQNIKVIEDYIIELKNNFKILHYDNSNVIIINNINNIINNMFEYEFNVSLSKLLPLYKNILVNDSIKNNFWNKILNNYDLKHSKVLIFITNLKYLFLNSNLDINIKKNIYYKIDIEKITNKIETNTFNQLDIIYILKFFSKLLNLPYNNIKLTCISNKKICSIDDWCNDCYINVIKYFKKLFNYFFIIH